MDKINFTPPTLYNLVMISRHRRGSLQAAPASRRRMPSPVRVKMPDQVRVPVPPALQVVPGRLASLAGQAQAKAQGSEKPPGSSRTSLLRYIDLHPALAVLIGVAIIALVCVIYLNQVTAVTNANYTLQALQADETTLLRQRENLQLEIGKAQSLSTIEKIAHDKLQMVPIGDHYSYVTIPSGPLSAMPPLPTPALPTPTPAQ